MKQRLRIAALGAGYFSQFHYEAWKRLGVEVVGVCDNQKDRAHEIVSQYDFGQAYDDLEIMLQQTSPDLLDIIIPPAGHLAAIDITATANVHMICQKPFTTSLAEAEKAVSMARNAGVALIVHENFRFQPWYAEIKNRLDEGMIGDPYQITFRLRPGDGQGDHAYLDRQPYFQKQPRFLVNETAVHLVDVFRYLFGEVKSVWADLRRLNPVIAGEDAGIFVCAFDNQRRALFDGNRLVDHIAENRRLTMGDMLLEGSAGAMRLDGDGGLFYRQHGSNKEMRIDYDWEDRAYAGDCVYRLQHHVVDHFMSNLPLQNCAEEYLNNLKIVEAIYRSNQTHRRLAVEMKAS